jgi:hypothetical protein
MISQEGNGEVELVRWTGEVEWKRFNEENRNLAQNSSLHLQN